MNIVQICLRDAGYAAQLRQLLTANGAALVSVVDAADWALPGVVVLDREHLDQLASPAEVAKRIVLVASDRDVDLPRAWDCGVTQVVFRSDPLSTAVLSVLAAQLPRARATQVARPPGEPGESRPRS